MVVKLYQDGVGRLYVVDGKGGVHWLQPLDEDAEGYGFDLPDDAEEIASCREIDYTEPSGKDEYG